jgi:hypothetical protein
MVLATSLLVGCEVRPPHFDEPGDVDKYIVGKKWSAACAGLDMREDIATHTAARLADHAHLGAVRSCLCEALYDSETHEVNVVVAEGLQGAGNASLAECLLPALSDTSLDENARAQAATALAGMDVREGYRGLASYAADASQPVVVRSAAAGSLRACSSCSDILVGLLEDPDAGVRVAAATSLNGSKKDTVRKALLGHMEGEESAPVRAAVLTALTFDKNARTDALACGLLMNDPEPEVRVAAANSFDGTKRKRGLACLKERLVTLEESPEVRSATLAALGASPSDQAAEALCDSIGPFLRLHVVDQIVTEIEGVNVIEAQNTRDWEASYKCVQKALGQGGYSCYARNHLGHWFRRLGGTASTPWCPGMPKN